MFWSESLMHERYCQIRKLQYTANLIDNGYTCIFTEIRSSKAIFIENELFPAYQGPIERKKKEVNNDIIKLTLLITAKKM